LVIVTEHMLSPTFKAAAGDVTLGQYRARWVLVIVTKNARRRRRLTQQLMTSCWASAEQGGCWLVIVTEQQNSITSVVVNGKCST